MKRNTLLLLVGTIIIIIMAIAVAVPISMRTRQLAHDYPIYTSNDTSYKFHSSPLKIEIKDGLFIWPATEKKYDTALLKIKSVPGLLSFFKTPNIAVRYKGHFSMNFLAPLSRSSHFINLSQLLVQKIKGNDRVALETFRTSLPDQTAHLYLFKNGPLAADKILIVAPHPDDAEIASFGLYDHYSGNNTMILTMTTGDGGGSTNHYYKLFPDKKRESSKFKGMIRLFESETVSMFGGIPHSNNINLKLPDGLLTELIDKGSIENLYGQKLFYQGIIKRIETILSKFQPTIIVTPHTLLDDHPDHIATTRMIISALRQYQLNRTPLVGRFFFYTNHHAGTHLFPYGPSSGNISLAACPLGTCKFDSIYSYQLSPAQVNKKLIALNMMSDLRDMQIPINSYSDHSFPYLRQFIRNTRSAIDSYFRMLCQSESYYRRSARPNEIFYVKRYEDEIKY